MQIVYTFTENPFDSCATGGSSTNTFCGEVSGQYSRLSFFSFTVSFNKLKVLD